MEKENVSNVKKSQSASSYIPPFFAEPTEEALDCFGLLLLVLIVADFLALLRGGYFKSFA